jgi:phosphocarrier protein HPr
MIERDFIIPYDTGFARPATQLVSIARRYKANISLEHRNQIVNLSGSHASLMDVMALNIHGGSKINVKANGTDEFETMQAIEEKIFESKQ